MNGGVAQAFPIPGKKGTGPFFSLKYNNRLSRIWKCFDGYIKKEENKAVLLLDTKIKSEYYFFFK